MNMHIRTFIRKSRKAIDGGRDILRGRRKAIYAHPMDGIHVQADFIPDIDATPSDVEIAERLLRSYSLATADDPERGTGTNEDIWTAIARRQGSFLDVLQSNNPERLASYLCNMNRYDATHGTVQGEDEYRHLKRSASYRRFVARMAKDVLPKEHKVSVCEIGGGVGRLAYWATRFGIGKYTLIDLPRINLLQGFFLLKALPDAKVYLYGEPFLHDDDHTTCVYVMPHHACVHSSGQFDLVVNQDSFPEINATIVSNYLSWIKVSTRSFLSINHESEPHSVNGALQNNVPELIARVGGFLRRSRQLYWLRKGYVCELYDIVG